MQLTKMNLLAGMSGLLLYFSALGQTALDISQLAQQNKLTVYNRTLTLLPKGEKAGIHLDARKDAGIAWLQKTAFENGVIEFDARGRDVYQQSFIGVAFHGVDDKTYDAIYFRPFNFRAEDPARHRHAVQYIALPEYDWPKLRQEHPDEYEKAVEPAPDPTQWFHVRIMLEGPTIRVYVNDQPTPCLTVRKLNERRTGGIGLWVGNMSDGDFANLKITPKQ